VKVLVIEDEPQIREIFGEYLELLGYEPDVTENGREGLARFDPLVHEIVITDFLLPGLTGFQIADSIRAQGHTTPIVMISGSAEPQDERRAAQAGFRFLHKPVAFAQFRATLAELAEHAGAAR
jgi:DNA-binding response OmpR family regulator